MKILQINASYKPAYGYGGPTLSVSKLSEALIKKGCIVEVFTSTANGKAELPVTTNIPQLVDGVRVSYFKRLTKDHSHFAPRLFLTLWKTVHAFDLVHIHAWWNLISILSCLIAHLRGIPVVFSPRGTLSSYTLSHKHSIMKKLFQHFAGRFLLNRCHLHSTSLREQKSITHLLKPLSSFQLLNLVNLPVHIPKVLPENGLLKLLFLSRIAEKKGIELLFEALSGLNFPYQLSIAGNGDQCYIIKLKALSRHYRIEQHIRWLGFTGTDKFELMAQHHLLVLPSYDENFGHVVIESLSVGTAVLVSNKVGLANYVRKNNLGWVCQTSAIAIKNSLFAIYHSQGMLEMIRAFAPGKIIKDFNNDKLINAYVHMYQQIIRSAKTAHD